MRTAVRVRYLDIEILAGNTVGDLTSWVSLGRMALDVE